MDERVLISLCNLPAPAVSGVVVLTMDGLAPLDLGRPSATVMSGLGLARGPGVVYYAYCAPEVRVAALDAAALGVIADTPVPEVADPHSLCLSGGRLVVVSTGTDEVLSYHLEDHAPCRPQVLWSPTGAGRDVHHINSVVEVDGHLVVSAFGPVAGPRWADARNGYVYDITEARMLATGLRHPHSLAVREGRLYFCDSPRSRVLDLEGTVAAEAQGYVRGLGFGRSSMLVGSSVGRRWSKSTGVENPADPGTPTGTCSVARFDCSTGRRLQDVDLSAFGTEVYDVLVLET